MHTESAIALNPVGKHLSGHVVPQTTIPQYEKKYQCSWNCSVPELDKEII